MLIQTKLTLVAVQEAGHNPVKASGLLFAHLDAICKRTRSDRSQIWTPGMTERPHQNGRDRLQTVADHRNEDAEDLFAAHRLGEKAFARDPLYVDE